LKNMAELNYQFHFVCMLLIKREEKQMVSNVTVIQCEVCIPQRKLMICITKLKENVRKEVFVSKCRFWKLKETDVHRNFQEQINAKAEAEFEGNIENWWMKLKERLLEVADEVCDRTYGHLRHRESWWWNEDVAKVIDEKRRLFKMW
jgi:hypothetical protein